ncbi:solute carrier family 22 member 7-like isoform X2 [Antennarius striatus]|uniref:solute carrier family 22 member 7-like isoform X2 n=1 Tax=Antennarius striatus TaxID=241820 RepID=UPI0035B0E535
MKFENILQEIDGFGPFQITIIFMLCSTRMVLPCHFLLTNFIGVLPPHHCDISTLDNGPFRNLTEQQRLTVSIPVQEDGSPKSCEMFAEPQFQLLANTSNSSDLPTVQCGSGWVYDNSTFTSTMATEWDLVCDRKILTKTSSTIFFLGVMVGAVALGYLSDKYGRKLTLLASFIMTILFGISSGFANSYSLFVVLRFLTGVGLTGISIISIVLSVEWVDVEHRSFIGVVGSLSPTVGGMMLAGLAFLIKDWRALVMTVTAPTAVALLTWWWIPESARWLLTSGKVERAQFYLDQCAKFNKRPKPSSTLILEEQCSQCFSGLWVLFNANMKTVSTMKTGEQNKNYTFLDLIKTPKLRKITLVTGMVWAGVAFTYYGISLNITGFGLNMYLTHFLYAAIEIPAKLTTYCLLNIIGRRWCQVGSLILTGTCIAINIFVPKDLWYVRAAVAVLGKGLSGCSFTTVYLYTTELFPTVLRQNGMGFTSFTCRVGMSLAPLILLLEDLWRPLSQIIFWSMATTCGLLCLLLPETLNVKLPETVDDIEKPRRGIDPHLPEFAGVFLGSSEKSNEETNSYHI